MLRTGKGCIPVSPYSGLCLINFVQSATFMCAELQARLFTRVLTGAVVPPPLEDQREEVEAVRMTLAARYIDRQQLRSQHGIAFQCAPHAPVLCRLLWRLERLCLCPVAWQPSRD